MQPAASLAALARRGLIFPEFAPWQQAASRKAAAGFRSPKPPAAGSFHPAKNPPANFSELDSQHPDMNSTKPHARQSISASLRFRMFMRMQVNFTGCRVLTYCVMSKDFHLLLEVPPVPEEGITDGLLLKRLAALFSEAFVAGVAARTVAAYIDLNPVRAGMVCDPADYRWSGYGEAIGGGKKGNGKKSLEGIVRACMSHKGAGFEAERWRDVSRIYRRALGMALGRKPSKTQDLETQDTRKEDGTAGMNDAEYLEGGGRATEDRPHLPELGMAKMLRCRVRYLATGLIFWWPISTSFRFTDGAVIGSKAFVNEAFAGAREMFTPKRRDGARRMRGSGKAAAGVLWSVRDLRVGV